MMHSDGGVNFDVDIPINVQRGLRGFKPATEEQIKEFEESYEADLKNLREKLVTEPTVPIPFSTDNEGVDYPTIARRFVQTEIESMGVDRIYLDQIYVVSFTYILGGWKAMVSTSLPDGKYYEVTHKPEHDGTDGPEATFVDTYVKVQNTKYSDE